MLFATPKNGKVTTYIIRFLRTSINFTYAKQLVSPGYLTENPNKPEADCFALKTFTDEDCHERDKTDCRQTWKDAPFSVCEKAEIQFYTPYDEALLRSAFIS
jgi:hypothetical protein